jgi:hypothetical protein
MHSSCCARDVRKDDSGYKKIANEVCPDVCVYQKTNYGEEIVEKDKSPKFLPCGSPTEINVFSE